MEAPVANKDLRELLIYQLKDTYYAENALLKALPKMARAARSPDLRSAIEMHREETEQQVDRLDRVFEILGERPQSIRCEAIEGIIREAEDIMQEFGGTTAGDAGIIAVAQAVEHYEIARYGTLMAWAKELGLRRVRDLLKQTLIEEENTDELLTELAEDTINLEATRMGEERRART
jgi:ferritin-like metal-binding protein YciE